MIQKIETNFKRNLFFDVTNNVKCNKIIKKPEFKVINIYPEVRFQKIYGFGGALTDASGYLLFKNEHLKKEVLENYYTDRGINYSFVRIPIASCDFSVKSYQYTSKKDLSDFTIEHDKKYIIPILKEIKEMNSKAKILASPWSPPSFMKNNKMLILGGKLKDKYKKTYAKYISKYILEYQKEGIEIDYITVQNEPEATQTWESCIFSAEEEIDFAVNYLAPEFYKNTINIKILIWDQNKDRILERVQKEMSSLVRFEEDGNVFKPQNVVNGFAYHYYTGDHFESIAELRNLYPDKTILHTEGCCGFSNFREEDNLKNAEIYAHDIIGDLNNGSNGYIDWNLILDNKGGPNHKNNFCDSPIMLGKDEKSYIKKLSYYYIGHFSKYIKPGAHRILNTKYTDKFEVSSFVNSDGSIVIILFNKDNSNYEYDLLIGDNKIHDNLDSHAIVTYVLSY